MRFGRNILILLLVIGLLIGGLVAERLLRPTPPLSENTPLFPVPPEAVTEIAWTPTDAAEPRMAIRREGGLWRMARPYPGVRCDEAAVAALLDALQALRVEACYGTVAGSDFRPARNLTVRTVENSHIRGFGGKQAMPMTQTLAEVDGSLVAVEADLVATLLDATPETLRTKSLIPFGAARVRALEWLAPERPLTRLTRKVNGQWEVSQPFRFEVSDEAVAAAIKRLAEPGTIVAYCLPADGTSPVTDDDLEACGLDDANALRLTLQLQGSAPRTLRFGRANPDPEHPDTVFCLPNDANRSAIVAIPKALPALFGPEGPFAADLSALPLLGAHGEPTRVSITRRDVADAPLITLARGEAGWTLNAPLTLTADTASVTHLLQALSAISGQRAGSERPVRQPFCVIALTGENEGDSLTLECFRDTGDDLLVWRSDQRRLYRVARAAFPEHLFAEGLHYALADRTVLALPAERIRRIDVRRRDGSACAIVRRPGETIAWETESPAGRFVNEAVLESWLACLADLKADRLLRDAPIAHNGLSDYGLDNPLLRLTLDLDVTSEGAMRHVLLIGDRDPETDTFPALIQGRGVLYSLAADDVALLLAWPMQETPYDRHPH